VPQSCRIQHSISAR